MKDFKKITIYLFLSILFFCSCSDDNNEPDLNNTMESSISYTINSQDYLFDLIGFGPVGGAEDNTSISGGITGDSNNSISFAITGNTVGAFSMYSLSITYQGNEYFDNENFNTNVTINNDEKIQGTFSGEITAGLQIINVNNGTFEVYLN